MNPILRAISIFAVVAAALWAAKSFSSHHHDENPFVQLFFHLVPAELVKDNHAEVTEPLFSIDTSGALGFLSVFTLDSSWQPTDELRIYNLQIFQLASVLLIFACFAGVATYVRTGKGDRLGKMFAGFATWVRDEMVYPTLGKELGRRFLPYFLTLFFFLLFINLLGLIPGSATATATPWVTAPMALTTLAIMLVGGMKAQGVVSFWKNLVPHVPLALWPLMFIVEVVGLLVKPFALTVRLFANISGGHMVVLSFMGLIFFFGGAYGAAGGFGVSPVGVGFGIFIMIIESFVAMLQAFIFTQLSIIFVGAALHPEH